MKPVAPVMKTSLEDMFECVFACMGNWVIVMEVFDWVEDWMG